MPLLFDSNLSAKGLADEFYRARRPALSPASRSRGISAKRKNVSPAASAVDLAQSVAM